MPYSTPSLLLMEGVAPTLLRLCRSSGALTSGATVAVLDARRIVVNPAVKVDTMMRLMKLQAASGCRRRVRGGASTARGSLACH